MRELNRLLGLFVVVCFGGYFSCESNDITVFNCAESDLSLNIDAVQGTSGCSIPDGSITVTALGGKEPYKFSINDLAPQSNGVFTNLLAGIYSVKVVDANKCEIKLNNINVTATGFNISADVEPDNLCVDGDGSVTITVEDGHAPPYQYQIVGQNFSDNNLFTGMEEGNHLITVKDNNDCTVQLDITIPHGNTGTSWVNDIKPIVEAQCATGGCHDGQFRPDLRIYDKAFFYRDLMKKYTQDGSMPFDGPKLTQDQVKLIACWVDDGAPQN